LRNARGISCLSLRWDRRDVAPNQGRRTCKTAQNTLSLLGRWFIIGADVPEKQLLRDFHFLLSEKL